MSDRWQRGDNRTRHDGKEDREKNGPVISLDPITMKPRRDITAEDQAIQNDGLGSLSFDAQKEAIRRANSILLARTLAAIERGNTDEATIGALAKCSTIAKMFLVEERHAGDGRDPTEMTDDEVDAELRKRGKK